MQNNLLCLIKMCSKYILIGIVAQFMFYSLILANDGKAQNKSIKEVKVNVKLVNASFEEFTQEVERQTDFKFFYNLKLRGINRFDLVAQNESLREVLQNVARETGLSFKQVNNSISVFKKPVSETPVVEEKQVYQTRKISGQVTSEDDPDGLPGVNIMVKGTGLGTVTDVSGKYQLEVQDGAVLVFSSVGYVKEEVSVDSKSVLNIQLVPDIKALEEIVVIGYGTMKKSDLTGSVASVKAKDIAAVPTNNVLESMQGKVAGVDLVRESGKVGAPIVMTVRGNRSLKANNSPLILVDGVAFGSDVNINPNDVESIEVLKDASATAIYGSRGANGVIMITTKKGKAGQSSINFNMYKGVNVLTRYPDLNNTAQYVAQRREAYRATGDWNSAEDDADIFSPVEYELIQAGNDTDWYNVLYDEGAVQDYQVSLSGGSEATKVALSLDYYNEKGILRNDNLDRYSGRFNINQKATDKLNAGVSLFFSYSKAHQRRDAIFDQVQKMAPFGVPYEEDGSINVYPFGNTDVNPLVDGYEENYLNEVQNYQTFLSANVDYSFTDNLIFRSNLGLNLTNYENGVFEGLGSTAYQSNQGLSKASKLERLNRGITWENTLTYDRKFGEDHAFTFLLGNSVLTNYLETTSVVGYDLGYEQAQFHNLGSAAGDKEINSSLTESSLMSYFGRLNYRLKEKYLFTFTLRADGSSVLGDENKWSYFPSAALAWRISEENFLSQSRVLSNLKLRTSLGVSGNSSVDPYQSSGVLAQTVYSFEESAAYGYMPGTISNENLKWERTKVFDIGMDVGIFEDRLTATMDVYKTWTTDLLMNRLIPSHTGYDNVLANVGATETKGMDLTITSYNISKGDFEWTTDLTFSANKEKITKLNDNQDDVGNSWFIGRPINVFYDYDKIGIWQSDEESEAESYGQEPGDIKVRDINDDGVIAAADDRIIIGQSTPKWTAGINNRISYKAFDLSIFAIARVGQKISSEAAMHFRPDSRENSAVVDYWTPENPTNAYPRPNSSKSISSLLCASTLGYRDASFLKIRTITLGYNVPDRLVESIGISGVRVYGTAKNYFTFSHFDDYDPERGGSSSYPMTKQLVFGANITF